MEAISGNQIDREQRSKIDLLEVEVERLRRLYQRKETENLQAMERIRSLEYVELEYKKLVRFQDLQAVELQVLRREHASMTKTAAAANAGIAKLREIAGSSSDNRVESIDGTLAFLVSQHCELASQNLVEVIDGSLACSQVGIDRMVAAAPVPSALASNQDTIKF
jgi:hypothetical protein